MVGVARMSLARPRRRRRCVLSVLLAAVLGAGLISAPAVSANPTKPPNPSDQQLDQARARKDAAANEVGTLSGRIAAAENQLASLNGQAQLAEQKLALALQREQQAKAVVASAKAALKRARDGVDQAHRQFVQFVQQSYMAGDIGGTTGVLLTADDPSALLEQSTLQQYIAQHQIDAIGRLSTATVAKSNADAAARLALQRQATATAAARNAQQQVLAALSQAKTQKAVLDQQLAADRKQLQTAQMALTGLTNQRAAYLAWKKRQDEIAAREAARKRALQLAQQRAAAAEAARQSRAHSGGGGSGGGGGSSSAAPSGGSWTPAKGRAAVQRAMRYLGWPYSWAAGNAFGPTYGVSEPGAAWNDSNIRGFDCSGLMMYAWGRSWVHYSATQYSQAGSYHPSIDQLMPGDLVFWSPGNGTVSGISHEAMYIGGGNVIQAPQSGDVIKITNVYNVESGYFGATRPLT